MAIALSRREALLTIPLLASSRLLGAEPKPFRLSTFTVEVTPPIGHPCMGGGISPVVKIIDPLYAIGFVLQGMEKPVVYVAVDWCEIRNDAYDRWREVIAENVGTTRERVMLSCLHQHDTPIADLTAQKLLEENGAKGAICQLKFHEATVQRVAKGIAASLKKSRPITHFGIGEAKVEKIASNRRYLDEKGLARYDRMSRATDPKIRDAEEGTIDPNLKTLSFWDQDKALVAIHAYATHPMSYYGRGGTTSDFVGMARQLRQTDDPSVLQIYLSGCSGNVTAGKYNDGSEGNRPVLATRLHEGMKEAWKTNKILPIEKLEFRNVPFELGSRTSTGFSEKELLQKLKEDPKPFGQCLAALGLSWQRRVARKQSIDLPILDFGKAALMVMPAESYVEYQLMAQAIRKGDTILVAGYGESGPGYIPIERAWKEHDGNLFDWCWVDPGCEAKMKAAMEKALKPK